MGNIQPGKNGFPRGPATIPFLGSAVDFGSGGESFLTKWMDLSRQYGSVCSVKLLSRWTVFVTGWQAAREALMAGGTSGFAQRPETHSSHRLNPKKQGIYEAPYSDKWQAQRDVVHQVLCDLDFGKVNLIQTVTEQVGEMIMELKGLRGQPVDPRGAIDARVTNVLLTVTTGQRFGRDDPQRRRVREAVAVLLSDTADWPPPPKAKVDSAMTQLNAYLVGRLARHESRVPMGDDRTEARDLVDAYLVRAGQEPGRYTRDELGNVMGDLLCCGIETVTCTLQWALVYMCRHPQVQERAYQEIIAVTGGRDLEWKDHRSLPYTQAALLEVQRLASVWCIVCRSAATDATLMNCRIPKGVEVWVNICSVHRDPTQWTNPEVFEPYRFLNSSGSDVIQPEAFIPYGAGPRKCPVEFLNHMELFLFFANILKHFRVATPPGLEAPSTAGVLAGTRMPKPFMVCLVPR